MICKTGTEFNGQSIKHADKQTKYSPFIFVISIGCNVANDRIKWVDWVNRIASVRRRLNRRWWWLMLIIATIKLSIFFRIAVEGNIYLQLFCLRTTAQIVNNNGYSRFVIWLAMSMRDQRNSGSWNHLKLITFWTLANYQIRAFWIRSCTRDCYENVAKTDLCNIHEGAMVGFCDEKSTVCMSSTNAGSPFFGARRVQ